ncbi:MAG: tryptophan synthase subunit alpha, partial [Candidatus Diapherotrites archaeon]|nr:tryptophan synthase subunit alpha [Candidatus Diapherotrites archaeon]
RAGGADALELGFAFSDPIADGKTIQEADQRALAKKIDTDKDFARRKRIRALDEKIPISLLVYYNLIFQRGVEKFYADAKKAGVDAVLAADCPIEEAEELLAAARESVIDPVFIVSPTTTRERMRKILQKCKGYVYLVSVLGVTGARASVQERTIELIRAARRMTRLPLCIGFGISRPEHAQQVIAAGAHGVIVGSAVVDIVKQNIGNEAKMLRELESFAAAMKKAAGERRN